MEKVNCFLFFFTFLSLCWLEKVSRCNCFWFGLCLIQSPNSIKFNRVGGVINLIRRRNIYKPDNGWMSGLTFVNNKSTISRLSSWAANTSGGMSSEINSCSNTRVTEKSRSNVCLVQHQTQQLWEQPRSGSSSMTCICNAASPLIAWSRKPTV